MRPPDLSYTEIYAPLNPLHTTKAEIQECTQESLTTNYLYVYSLRSFQDLTFMGNAFHVGAEK